MTNAITDFFLSDISWSQIIIRVLFAVIVGVSVGFERELSNHPAGLKTHALVCLGAAIASMISHEMCMMYGVNEAISQASKIDVSRIASGVVSGIGFIGAGAIIKSKDGLAVTGITTAATIWISGCMGLAIGMGYFRIALIAFIATMLSTILLKLIEDKFIKTRGIKTISVVVKNKSAGLEIIDEYFIKNQITVASFKCTEADNAGQKYLCEYSIRNPKTVPVVTVISDIARLSDIDEVYEGKSNKPDNMLTEDN